MTVPSKAQLRWQCRRGMLELDFLFERFIENKFDQLNDADKITFAKLLTFEDPVLYQWLLDAQQPEQSDLKRIVDMIK